MSFVPPQSCDGLCFRALNRSLTHVIGASPLHVLLAPLYWHWHRALQLSASLAQIPYWLQHSARQQQEGTSNT